MFEQAKKNAPCIIFIDEIDAVGRHRGAGLGGGNDEREQTLNQLLVEMDGFEANEGIIIIAATNRPDVLDPALLRPGRFDRQIIVPNPDVGGREKILNVHMRKVPLAPDVDPKVIARGTPGFSGADLANLVNEAALLAARRNKRLVTQAEFEDAKDKVMMGAERRSMVMTEEEKLATAYHEAGHALVNMLVPGNDPLHKVTIIPRGRALGVTMSLPERDKLSYSKQWCEARIAIMFGGRVAEQLIYGEDHLNTGASSDIMQATELARRMVTEWGMSEKLGPLRYNENQQEVFLGHAITQRQNMSEETAQADRRGDPPHRHRRRERRRARCSPRNRDKLEAITQALMEYETISGEEVQRPDARREDRAQARRRRPEGPDGLGGAECRRALPPREDRPAWSRSRSRDLIDPFTGASERCRCGRGMPSRPLRFGNLGKHAALDLCAAHRPLSGAAEADRGRLERPAARRPAAALCAVEIAERDGARVKRRIASLGDAIERDWGRGTLDRRAGP